MKTQFDIPAMVAVYLNSTNYKIVQGDSNAPNRCFIFFSSNGLYFPNTETEFHRKVVLGDRYEWEKLSPPKSEYRKAIFIRDVRKTWYVDGISKQLNSIESVLGMLKNETRDFAEVICVGNSAGGYAATLFGMLLGADKIFSISGYFDITSLVNDPTNLALQQANLVPEKFKWFDLSSLLSNNDCSIYFLFPENCEMDKLQARIIENVQSVRVFPFKHDTHGVCAQNFVYPYLFVKSKAELDSQSYRVRNKSWSKVEFSIALIGLRETLLCLVSYFSTRSLRLIFK